MILNGIRIFFMKHKMVQLYYILKLNMFNSFKNNKKKLIKNLSIVFLSVLIAIILAKTDAFRDLLISIQGLKFIGSFIAGIFFISVFTVAPASVMLFNIAQITPIWEVAILGGLGAVVGDFIIFRFIKNNFADEVINLLKKTKIQKIAGIIHLSAFRWLVPFIGALIIASPLPDELGLTMMGLSKVKTSTFVLISFILNSLGILALVFIIRGY